MGLRLEREKPRNLFLSLMYRLHRLLPLSPRRKLDFYLDLEWISWRLAVETSFDVLGRRDHPFTKASEAFIRKRLRRTDRVLDIGCGYGTLCGAIAPTVQEVVGVDFDRERIATASRTYPEIKFICTDAREFLQQAPGFNVAVLSHVLEHIDDPVSFLRSLSVERLYVEVPDFDGAQLNELRQIARRDLIYSDADHVAEFDREQLASLLAKCGFEIVDEDYRSGVMRLWSLRA